MLLQALADFPAVVSRRIDAEPGADSPWHELGRALIAQGVALGAHVGASIQLRRVRPLRARSSTARTPARGSPRPTSCSPTWPPHGGRQAERDELLDALFDGRADDSTRAYLRQAMRWLRHVLPRRALGVQHGACSAGRRRDRQRVGAVRGRLAEAARLRGRRPPRGDARARSRPFDRGEYLPGAARAGSRSAAATCRARDRRALRGGRARVRGGRLEQARALVGEVLRADRYREAAWRLTMRMPAASATRTA